MKTYRNVAIVLVLGLVLTACAGHPRGLSDVGGFLSGLFHGLIAPLALIGSLFIEGLRIYDCPNAGFLYDAGYLLGLYAVFGGTTVIIRPD
jgi:hypothetical protein